jgi:hypothetical protein
VQGSRKLAIIFLAKIFCKQRLGVLYTHLSMTFEIDSGLYEEGLWCNVRGSVECGLDRGCRRGG